QLRNEERPGPVGCFLRLPPAPRAWLRGRRHVRDQPEHGQRVHVRQKLEHVRLVRAGPVPTQPFDDGQSAVVQELRGDPHFIADQNLWRPSGLGPGSENFQVGDPFLSFGGGQEASEASYTSSMTSCVLPCTNWNNAYTASDSVSKVWGKHNFKAGLYFERTGKTEQDQLGAQYLGAYSFASSTAMSNNTQDGYANAFLGNFNSYTEAGRVVGDYWFMDIESFIQDNWRISKRLTLDLGVRFYHQVPSIDHSN